MSWTPPVALDRTNIAEAVSLIRAPFSPAQIEWRVGSTNNNKTRGMALCYIDARAVRRRLNKVLGEWNWRTSFRVYGSQMICKIAIRIEKEWVTKSDGSFAGSLASTGKPDAKEEQRLDMEGKGAFSTAFKRAAVCWGVGEYLYDLPSPWVAIDERKAIEKGEMATLDAVAAAPFEEWKKKVAERDKALGAAPPPSPRVLPPTHPLGQPQGPVSEALQREQYPTEGSPNELAGLIAKAIPIVESLRWSPGDTAPTPREPSSPPVDESAQEPAPTNDVADQIAVIVGRMNAAPNETSLAACVDDIKRLGLTDDNLSKAAKLAWSKNAKRLGISPKTK